MRRLLAAFAFSITLAASLAPGLALATESDCPAGLPLSVSSYEFDEDQCWFLVDSYEQVEPGEDTLDLTATVAYQGYGENDHKPTIASYDWYEYYAWMDDESSARGKHLGTGQTLRGVAAGEYLCVAKDEFGVTDDCVYRVSYHIPESISFTPVSQQKQVWRMATFFENGDKLTLAYDDGVQVAYAYTNGEWLNGNGYKIPFTVEALEMDYDRGYRGDEMYNNDFEKPDLSEDRIGQEFEYYVKYNTTLFAGPFSAKRINGVKSIEFQPKTISVDASVLDPDGDGVYELCYRTSGLYTNHDPWIAWTDAFSPSDKLIVTYLDGVRVAYSGDVGTHSAYYTNSVGVAFVDGDEVLFPTIQEKAWKLGANSTYVCYGGAKAPVTINIVGTAKATSLAGAKVTLANASAVYTGKAIKPSVKSVVLNGKTLKAGADYTVAYKNNVKAGTATVVVTGKGNYAGAKSATFKIKPASVTAVALKKTSATYAGKAQKPAVKAVKASSLVLKTTDYAVSYRDAKGKTIKQSAVKAAGRYKVVVTGKGNFAGSRSVTFSVTKAKQPMAVKAVAKAAKLATVQKKAVVLVGCVAVKNAKGKVSYANASVKSAARKFKVNSTKGTITVPKDTKKGTYSVKIKVTAKGGANYKPGSKAVTVKVTVK